MGGSGSFEEMAGRFDADLKALAAAGGEIVTVLGRMAAGLQASDAADLALVDEGRKLLLAQQLAVHNRLAQAVVGISAAIEEERAVFERREVPLRSDILLGFLSKRAMRRRMERRALRSGCVERLRTALGRADRLAGRIDAQRQSVMAQRMTAETLLGGIPGRRDAARENVAAAGDLQLHAVTLIATVVDALNLAVRDLTLLLQKLIFDVEGLLDQYSVRLSFRRDRQAHVLTAEAYPYFCKSVGRLASDILPGARLADGRRKIDFAFAERFAPA
jgi:hypothetical protein